MEILNTSVKDIAFNRELAQSENMKNIDDASGQELLQELMNSGSDMNVAEIITGIMIFMIQNGEYHINAEILNKFSCTMDELLTEFDQKFDDTAVAAAASASASAVAVSASAAAVSGSSNIVAEKSFTCVSNNGNRDNMSTNNAESIDDKKNYKTILDWLESSKMNNVGKTEVEVPKEVEKELNMKFTEVENKLENLVPHINALIDSVLACINIQSLPHPSIRVFDAQLISDPSYEFVYYEWLEYLRKYYPAGDTVCEVFGRSYLRSVILAASDSLLACIDKTCLRHDMKNFFTLICMEAGINEKIACVLYEKSRMKADKATSTLHPQTGLGYLKRDTGAIDDENKGLITFECITNDRKPNSMIRLIAVKNVFAKQLPKMPREYICRLVLDRNHYTFCLLKNSELVGCVCFRPYFRQRFAEIAFLAVTSTEQVKGYGTRLMHHLKEHVKRSGIEYFLTYADNFALGYFRKQGFTSKITLPKERWYGFIKDYDGGTLMQCYISPEINHLRLGEMLHEQKKLIRLCMDSISPLFVYPGLHQDWWRDRKQIPLELIPGFQGLGWESIQSGEYKYSVNTARMMCKAKSATAAQACKAEDVDNESINVVENVIHASAEIGDNTGEASEYHASGGTAEKNLGVVGPVDSSGMAYEHDHDIYARCHLNTRDTVSLGNTARSSKKALCESISNILLQLEKHPSGWPFKKPVSASEAPDYYKIIEHPSDIQTMRKRNKNGEYLCKDDIVQDVKRMFSNCRYYNGPDSIYYKYADEVEKFISPKLDQIQDI